MRWSLWSEEITAGPLAMSRCIYLSWTVCNHQPLLACQAGQLQRTTQYLFLRSLRYCSVHQQEAVVLRSPQQHRHSCAGPGWQCSRLCYHLRLGGRTCGREHGYWVEWERQRAQGVAVGVMALRRPCATESGAVSLRRSSSQTVVESCNHAPDVLRSAACAPSSHL